MINLYLKKHRTQNSLNKQNENNKYVIHVRYT